MGGFSGDMVAEKSNTQKRAHQAINPNPFGKQRKLSGTPLKTTSSNYITNSTPMNRGFVGLSSCFNYKTYN